jgi:hypothetical protein
VTWEEITTGVWYCRVRSSLLSLYVVRDVDGKFWPQINGIVSPRPYDDLSQAQRIALGGARKLVKELMEELG